MIIIFDSLLKDYYNIIPTNIVEKDNYIFIEDNSDCYFLYEINSIVDIDYSYNLSLMVDYSDLFILNNFGKYYTIFNNRRYSLLKRIFSIHLNSAVLRFFYVGNKHRLNWRLLWIRKCDYYVSFYESIKGKFPLIDESISYYIGLFEMGIYYLKFYENYSSDCYVQHRCLNSSDYTNPFNMIIDVKERDFAEYLKYIFFNDLYKDDDLYYLIHKGKNYFEFDLVIARMLLPNYYFEALDEVASGKKNEDCIMNIITRATDYESYLKRIICIISKFYSIKKYPFL